MVSYRSALLTLLFLATSSLIERNLLQAIPLAQEIANAQKEKKKKAGLLSPGDGSTISSMSYADLRKNKCDLIAKSDIFTAIKYLERMIPLCDDHTEKRELILELADCFCKREDYKHALRVYNEFTLLYPGSDQIGYALKQAIYCSFKQALGVDRDQTQTEDTLKLIAKFYDRKDPSFAVYLDEVKSIEAQCRQKLFDHNQYILEFYLMRGNLVSAQRRYEVMVSEFQDIMPHTQPQLMHLQIKLADAKGETELATKTKIELAQKFPETEQGKDLAPQLSQLNVQLAALQKPEESEPSLEQTPVKVSMVERF